MVTSLPIAGDRGKTYRRPARKSNATDTACTMADASAGIGKVAHAVCLTEARAVVGMVDVDEHQRVEIVVAPCAYRGHVLQAYHAMTAP
jgi:predicted RNA methylase